MSTTNVTSPLDKCRGFPPSRAGYSCFAGSSPTSFRPHGSYTASTGRHREPLGQNVLHGIDIPVMPDTALWTDPFTHIKGEVFYDMLAILEVGSFAGCETPIVHEAATSERLRQDALLFVGRIEPVLVCPLLLRHRLFTLSLLFTMLFQCCDNLSIQRSVVLLCGFPYLFQQMCRKPDGECLYVVFHVFIVILNCNYCQGL